MALFRQKKIIMLFCMVLALSVIMLILILDANQRNSDRLAPNFSSENLMDSSKFNTFRSQHDANLCSSLPPLTYIEKRLNHFKVILKINRSVIPLYTPFFTVNCCYSKAKRYVAEQNPDEPLRFSECLPFRDSVQIIDPIIKILCINQSNIIVYTNVHVIISPIFLPYLEENNYELMARVARPKPPVNVLLFGFDGMSKQNLEGKMPKTYDFIQRNGFFDINASSSLLEIFDGSLKAQLNSSCGFDILDEYKRSGYITAFGEDSSASTLLSGGKSPTDFYFRPYMLEAANLERNNREAYYCAGSEDKAERIMNMAKDFQITLEYYPTFALFIMNSFSYRITSALDKKTENFLHDLHNHLNNTIFMFFSNSKSIDDKIGRVEESPFLYIHLPNSFGEDYWNLEIYSYKNTNALDLYMTLQDVLRLTATNYINDANNSVDCPRGQSLLVRMPKKETLDETLL